MNILYRSSIRKDQPDEFENDEDDGDVETDNTVTSDELVLTAHYPVREDVELHFVRIGAHVD
jgi:hypothetical protein